MTASFSMLDWEEYARCYDTLLHLTPYTDMLHCVSEHVHTTNPTRILDASCGTGNLAVTLFKQEPKTKIEFSGVDRVDAMLERARSKCSSMKKCSFEHANLDETLAFKSETFSHVVSLNTLYAVYNPLFTLQEFFRVLKPGGHAIIVTPKCAYENGIILKTHCGSTKPDSYWTGIHENTTREELLVREAIHDETVVQAMLQVAHFNRLISAEKQFHFYEPGGFTKLVCQVGFSIQSITSTYANQDILAILRKGD